MVAMLARRWIDGVPIFEIFLAFIDELREKRQYLGHNLLIAIEAFQIDTLLQHSKRPGGV